MSEEKEDKYSYKGWLLSDSFLKRAFAVMGYNMIAALMVWAGLILLTLLFAIIGTLASGIY